MGGLLNMTSIISEPWHPIDEMPAVFTEATFSQSAEGLLLELLPSGGDKKLLMIFHDAVAFAMYDDLVFSISDIESGYTGSSACILRGVDWPVSHDRINAATPRSVIHYRIFTSESVLDVLASGTVKVMWSPAKTT